MFGDVYTWINSLTPTIAILVQL